MRHQEKDRSRIILGIDPGSIVCGFGIIKTACRRPSAAYNRSGHIERISTARDFSYVASGCIELAAKSPLYVRLKEIYDSISEIIKEYSPDEVAVEKVFFAKSVKSALTLGQARGAALLAAASHTLPVYEYSALEIKKAIVGYGRAEKHQVQGMVSKILDIRIKLSKDSADALGLALCHGNTIRFDK